MSLQKTVLLRRGVRGYGFNLAEEYPCYLSAVHEGGVAWKAGLRTGDRLASVGSLDVSNMPHKDIVRMIADFGETLRLTVLSTPQEEPIETARRDGRSYSCSSSSDCDSDNEIWRRKKSDLAQKLQQKRPRRSRYKNLITPISEVLFEDGMTASSGSGVMRKRGRRYISATDRRVFCAVDQPIFDESTSRQPTSLDRSDFAGGQGQFSDQRILHSALVHRPISPPAARQAKRRPVSVLNMDDVLSPAKDIGRLSRSPAKTAKRRTLSGGKKSMGNRSSSAPDYKRGFYQKSIQSVTEASTIARVGLVDGQQLSSGEDGTCDDISGSSENEDDEEEDLIKKSVVVYIGAVPVPSAGASRKNILKSALHSLRAQRVRAHTVMLEIFTTQIVITNSKGVMTNRFRADRIAYATSCAENKQYFGLVTVMEDRGRQNRTTTTDETDDSPMAAFRLDADCSDNAMVCHVFAVDPQLHLHSFHYHYARKFGIHCVRDPETNFCQEFPYSSNAILQAVGYVYRNHRNGHILNRFTSDSAAVKAPFLQAGAVAYVSSNSDSGIGNGREDFSPLSALRATDFPPPAYPGISSKCASKIGTIERVSSSGTPTRANVDLDETQKGKISPDGKKLKAVRFMDDRVNGVDKADQPLVTAPESKADSCQDLLDTVSGNPVASSATSRKGSKDQSGPRQGQQTTHYVSSSAIDVHQLATSGSKGATRGTVPHKGPLGVTKSVAVGQILARGSGAVGSANEIRCNSPRNIGGSIEQLSSTSSSRQALSIGSKYQTHQVSIGRESCAGSISSLLSTGDAGGLHKVASEPNPRCSTAGSGVIGTKHGSLLRDRINRRLNRNAGGDQIVAGGAGIRTTSIRMKQALKERLEGWSSDFDRLLRDPAGLHAFSEFLRTQYCQENVNFWIACENYKLADENTRTHFATELYRSYFASGCMEPVNVDSLARQMIQEAMETENFTSSTFNPAQYQIFHLMKYDCYPRFLKSDEYQRCWESCEKGQQLPEMKEPFLHNVDLSSGSSLSLTTKSSCGGSDEPPKKSAASSRKSILPWKNKFSAGVNIMGRNKNKKEDESLHVAQQPSTSASFGVGVMAATGGGESAPEETNTALSSVGSKRKQAWRHSKQLSTPADVVHAVRKPSGSVEGLHHLPMQSRPSNGLTVIKPDIIPQPDPPSSPSPGPHPRNPAHLHPKTAPGSPLLTKASPTSPEEGKLSCTLILPSREQIQIAVSEDLTVRRWLHELALRLSLNAAATDIIDVETDDPVDLATNAGRALAGKTIRLEGGVLFKVDLPYSTGSTAMESGTRVVDAPQRKLIAVKARAESAAGQVLRPILNKYGLQLDSMVVCVAGTNEVLPNHSPIASANNKKLMVLTQKEFEDWVHRDHDAASLLSSRSSPSRSSLSPSFEDIIGAKYFQELPAHRGLGIAELPPESDAVKAGRHHQQHSASVNAGHKHGAGGMLKFVKRGAAEATSSAATKILGSQTKSLRLSAHPGHHHAAAGLGSSSHQHGAAPGKKSVLSKQELLELAREEKRLAELLGRAQASSFDDQRGASVKNFELPDFLKQPTPLTVSHLGAAGASGAAAGIQSSSMDDSLIPTSTNDVTAGQRSAYHSRPTEMVHRKLCGSGGMTEETGGVSTASGSCDDDFAAYEPLTERSDVGGTEGDEDLLKCAVTINGEKSEIMLCESKIPSHEEAEALFSDAGGDAEAVDFNDPLMTERRRLSDFGLGTLGSPIASENVSLDNTIRSGAMDERVSTSAMPTGTQRAPPPPYQKPRNFARSPIASGNAPTPQVIKSATDTGIASPSCEQRKGAASVGDMTGILDQEKKRKGLYVHHQDDDWQVDYV